MKAVIGTNSWGSKTYATVLRGYSVNENVIAATAAQAYKRHIPIFDTAPFYGLGEAEKLLGKYAPEGSVISDKFSPKKKYRYGSVRKALESSLTALERDIVDIYWLHLPVNIADNLSEMAEILLDSGKIRSIGISNFNTEECEKAKEILDIYNVPLYGVQNHYSILSRDWEKNGLTAWCRENNAKFWAWAVLEEGMLIPPNKDETPSVLKIVYDKKRFSLAHLYKTMSKVGKKYGLSHAETAISFCSAKGIIPVCGCRRPSHAASVCKAVNTLISAEDVLLLENAADETGITLIGSDMFRMIR